jgi:membrane-associated phospholipid phosphatase
MMEPLLQWGLDVIRAVQSAANTPLTIFMKSVTALGTAPAYMVLLPLIFWCADEKKGVRLGIMVMITLWVNLALKFLFHQPRPFWPGYDPALGMIAEHFGGLPSGHAQNSLVLGFVMASWGKNKGFYALALFASLLIGFSRIYLGVHFPTDVFAGWIIGGLLLTAYFLLGPRLETALARGDLRFRLILTAAASFIMILYRPGDDLLTPGGVLLGLGPGYSLNLHFLRFRAAALFGRRGAEKFFTLLLRFLLGMAGFLIITLIFSKIIPENQDSPYFRILFFLRLGLWGFWIYAGAPWLFQRIRLAEQG